MIPSAYSPLAAVMNWGKPLVALIPAPRTITLRAIAPAADTRLISTRPLVLTVTKWSLESLLETFTTPIATSAAKVLGLNLPVAVSKVTTSPTGWKVASVSTRREMFKVWPNSREITAPAATSV